MKRLLFVLMLAAAVPACGPKVPASYAASDQRASDAKQLLDSLQALGVTVINLNALAPGSPGRVPDADVAAIRDGSLVISAGLTSYVSTGLGKAMTDGYTSLMAALSSDTKLSPTVRAALALVNTNIQLVLGGLQ